MGGFPISERDRRTLQKIGHRRILTDTQRSILQELMRREVWDRFNNDPNIAEKNPDFVRETFNEIFKREKILCTNLKRVWNPFDWMIHQPVKDNNGEYSEGLPIAFCGGWNSGYRFILILDDPRELRNIKLRRKRKERRDRGILRICKECQKEFRAIHRDTIFCSTACKMKAYRRRKRITSSDLPKIS